MPYVARTQEEILEELKTQSDSPESRVEGTFSYDCFATNAFEFAKMESELAELYQAAFGDTTYGEYLDMRCHEHGIIRRPATKSKGAVEVVGKGTVLKGTIFATSKNVRFVATSDTEIDGTGVVEIEAVNAGAEGNVAAGAITKMPMNVAGIQSVTNAEPTVDGYDEEDDDTLRDRYLTYVRYPSTSGNPQHYINWALEVSGVGAASCIRCWAGRGTVKVIIVDANFESPNDELIERVAANIEIKRPIGAEVTVSAAEPVTVDITANITGAIDVDAFKAGVMAYFKKLMLSRFIDYTSVEGYEEVANVPAGIVSRAMFGNIIIESGATDYDYDSMRLNGLYADISLTVSQIPRLGTFTFTIVQTIKG